MVTLVIAKKWLFSASFLFRLPGYQGYQREIHHRQEGLRESFRFPHDARIHHIGPECTLFRVRSFYYLCHPGFVPDP